jgi:hypothetical protein
MVYQLEANEHFPSRVKLGPRAVGWLAHEVRTWIATRIRTPQTDDRTKFRGGKWWLLGFGPMRNDVCIAPNGQSFCFSGQCASPYIPASTSSTRLPPLEADHC